MPWRVADAVVAGEGRSRRGSHSERRLFLRWGMALEDADAYALVSQEFDEGEGGFASASAIRENRVPRGL